jgi:hypothetical protein
MFLSLSHLPVLDTGAAPARQKICTVDGKGAIPHLQPGENLRREWEKDAVAYLQAVLAGAITSRATGPKSVHQ